MLPYEALLQTQSLTKKDLPSEIQRLIKRIESTRNTILVNKKTDENGNPIVSENVKTKINQLDSEIVNATWDFIEGRQKTEKRASVPNSEPKKEEAPEHKKEETVEIKKEETSSGNVGFFSF
tara:strand:- start:293 stop:658 length:366 start_codon:yes stop_codon:yes gene_type:complete